MPIEFNHVPAGVVRLHSPETGDLDLTLPAELPAATQPLMADADGNLIYLPLASQDESEEGTEESIRAFSPLRISQAIAALGAGGPAGPQGEPGADGSDGKTILNGTSDPTTEGVDGDFFINTATDEIFGPKTAGAWGAGTSLIGPEGPQGAAGADGTDGSDGAAGADGAAGPNTVTTSTTTNITGLLKGNGVNCGQATADTDYIATRAVCLVPFASDETVAVGDGTIGFCVPASMNGKLLTAVTASVATAGTTSGTTDVQVRRKRGAAVADMLSTKVTLSASEYTASDGVVDVNNDDLATGDLVFVDVDAINAVAPIGLSVVLTFA